MLTIRGISRLALMLCFPFLVKGGAIEESWQRASSEEEAFFLRRIADFWEEGEYGIAKSQMEAFLLSFPTSEFSDLIRICLGDVFLREKNFSGALASYAAISCPENKKKVLVHQMECLYRMEWYSTLADECEEYLKQAEDSELKINVTFYLAIALYHQCLNSLKEPETLLRLIQKAQPHFEALIQRERNIEIAQAFAHLCCLSKDFKRAADIYLELASADPLSEEEMVFQAALIQTEYDKNLALQSFEKIAKEGKIRAQEAAYHHLVLSLETGSLETIVNHRASILASMPEDRKGVAHFILGRALLSAKQWGEAIHELNIFLVDPSSSSPETIRSGLFCLMEAARQSMDIDTLDGAIAKLLKTSASDEQIGKARLIRVQLLKNTQRMDEARAELEVLLAMPLETLDRAASVFESIDLEYRSCAWEKCRSGSLVFLEQFPDHPLASFVWRCLATASCHLAREHPEKGELLSQDLKALLQQRALFSPQEMSDWKFYLAQIHFHLGQFEEAICLLQPSLEENLPFSQKGNAWLLLGLCYRDGKNDLVPFCLHGESALALEPDLMEPALLHISLFNAYLELSKQTPLLMEGGAKHLYEAFIAHADIAKDNLLWLGEWFFSKKEYSKAAQLFSHLMAIEFNETACYRMGKIDSYLGHRESQISQMEKLIDLYNADPNRDWQWQDETKLLLAEGYREQGLREEALRLLNEITEEKPAIRSEAIAQAYLEKAQLCLAALRDRHESFDEHQLADVASQFKNLSLQRRLENEPIHLEAALDYVSLLTMTSPERAEKRLTLLEKIKRDFEKSDDLLSKEYCYARLKYPDKNQVFEEYMKYIDEEILAAKLELTAESGLREEWRAKAKDRLLQIKSECTHPMLIKRIASRLQDIDVSVAE